MVKVDRLPRQEASGVRLLAHALPAGAPDMAHGRIVTAGVAVPATMAMLADAF